jgi:hypothetical protein
MSTSTIQKVTDNLQKQAEDRKAQLTGKYQTISTWLQNELETMRQLIMQSEQTQQQGPADAEDAAAPAPVTAAQEPVEAPKESERASNDQGRTKRKGPEAELHSSFASPEFKRTSNESAAAAASVKDIQIDTATMEKLFAAAGLPADLNKLKKEQLLVELQARQVTTFSMKSLKKDMTDALTECIARLHKQTLQQQNTHNNKESSTVASVVAAPEIAESVALATNGSTSILQAFRKSIVVNETEEARNARIQNEFEARQRRHRNSQSAQQSGINVAEESCTSPSVSSKINPLPRESIASTTYSTVLSEDSADDNNNNDDAVTINDVEIAVLAKMEETNIDAMNNMHISEVHQQMDDTEEGEVVEEFSATNTWMEVTSPAPAPHTAPSNDHVSLADRLESAQAAPPALSNLPRAIIPSLQAVVESHTAPTPAAADANKKPTNILSGTTSFLEKPVEKVQAKQVVAVVSGRLPMIDHSTFFHTDPLVLITACIGESSSTAGS